MPVSVHELFAYTMQIPYNYDDNFRAGLLDQVHLILKSEPSPTNRLQINIC